MQNKAIGRNTKKKVAIITLYDDYNIGNKLQNYALQESIKAEGYACETVDTRSFGRWRLTWRGWLVFVFTMLSFAAAIRYGIAGQGSHGSWIIFSYALPSKGKGFATRPALALTMCRKKTGKYTVKGSWALIG